VFKGKRKKRREPSDPTCLSSPITGPPIYRRKRGKDKGGEGGRRRLSDRNQTRRGRKKEARPFHIRGMERKPSTQEIERKGERKGKEKDWSSHSVTLTHSRLFRRKLGGIGCTCVKPERKKKEREDRSNPITL